MIRIAIFLATAILISAPPAGSARNHDKKRPAETPAITDKLQPLDSISLRGYVAGKLDASYEHRILAQDAGRLIEPFRHRTESSCWQSEFWGKWFTSAVLAYRYKPEPGLKQELDRTVADLIATQTTDGYIGNYKEDRRLEQWDIWGRKYCMLGLLAWYDVTHDKKCLQAASRLADNLITELAEKKAILVKKGNHRGMAASSVLEPIVLLYTRTKDPRYLTFAEDIVRQWESPDGPKLISLSSVDVDKRFPKPKSWFGWEQGAKAYEMMSCYEGLLELYRVTGNAEYLQAVESTWEHIMRNEINITGSGSSVECWFHGVDKQAVPVSHYQETCVTATWIKLNQQLLRLTGDPKYADAIETSFYNALLGSMSEDGSTWSKYTPLLGRRQIGGEQCGMGINCCIASGPRGLFTIPFTVLMRGKIGFQINFFIPGSYQSHTPSGQNITFTQATDYPSGNTTSIRLDMARSEEFTISIRIPAWSSRAQLTVNGQPVKDLQPGTLATIRRKWSAGDEITLKNDMRGRIITLGNSPSWKAIMRGPVVLARDQRLGGANVDDVITPVTDPDGYFPLEPVNDQNKDMWMVFKGTFQRDSENAGETTKEPLQLCDYASAGKTYDEKSWFRVWFEQYLNPAR
ncbi:MAG TPA: beta-L-arabinofuranosidase domain-containing protein [Puia sp.]|nr:beta-L-arabinofuranosidase domain-containing protein [Puia sp.]